MKAGEKVKKIVFVFVILIIGIAAGVYFAGRFLSDRGSGIVIDSSEEAREADTEVAGIQFPVYPDIDIDSGETYIPILLSNPSGNPCYFQFTVSIDDGQSFYSSDWVEPGKAIRGVDSGRSLSAGDHILHLQIATKAADTGQTMNGGNIEVHLHVR